MQRFSVLLFSALITGGLVAPAAAQPVQSDEERRLQEIEQQLQENARNADEIKRGTPLRERELSGLRTRLIETAASLKEAETRATEIEQRLTVLEEEIAVARTDLNRQRYAVSDILAALQSLEMSKPPALAVSPDDAAEAARAAMALSATVPDLQARVDLLQESVTRLDNLQATMDEEQQALAMTQDELDSREKILESLLNEKEAEFRAANERVARLEAENKQLAREASTIREVLNRLDEREQEQPVILAQPAPRVTPKIKPPRTASAKPVTPEEPPSAFAALYRDLPATFAEARGKLPYPVSGRLTGKYGSETLDGSKLEGLQIETRGGAVVTAPYGGKVAFAENLGSLGNVFILDVGQNYHLVMVGFARLDATVGQEISAGEPVGKMPEGNEREELYFEIRRNREPLNPARWLLPQTAG